MQDAVSNLDLPKVNSDSSSESEGEMGHSKLKSTSCDIKKELKSVYVIKKGLGSYLTN